MNTDQRKLLRNGCYFFAGTAALAGAGGFVYAGDATTAAGFLGAAALVIAGKFIWAGRDATQPSGK
jgi:hypothetical protein